LFILNKAAAKFLPLTRGGIFSVIFTGSFDANLQDLVAKNFQLFISSLAAKHVENQLYQNYLKRF
jgi:hypothetical protein